jgi:archaemetzincin
MIRFTFLSLLIFGLFSCNNSILKNPDKQIGILPYKGITSSEIDSVKNILTSTYKLKVIVLNEINLPKSAFTTVRSPRYRADSLIRIQSRHIPDSISIVIGLTNKDISTTKIDKQTGKIKKPESTYKDWGIFGLGQVGGNSCIVSTNRLHNGVSKSKFYTRLQRISTHEVGHVLGLSHCPTPQCVMNDANESIKTIDKSTGELCNACWSEIR